MRKYFLVLFLVFVLPLALGVGINMNNEFSQGETIFATIDGNFVSSPTISNIYFYRDYVRVPFEYNLEKIDGNYYVYVQTEDKAPNNYSMVLKGIEYYTGEGISNKEIKKYFLINNNKASFSVNPGIIFAEDDFRLSLHNLESSSNTISVEQKVISGYSKGLLKIWAGTKEISNSITLSSGQEKNLEVLIDEINESSIRKIIFSSGELEYEVIVEISVPEPIPEKTFGCLNGIKESGEQCDIKDFGDKEDCSDININWFGGLSCFSDCTLDFQGCSEIPANSTQTGEDCLVNWNCNEGEECINRKCVIVSETPENNATPTEEIICGNGILEQGEQCDKKNFGGASCESLFDDDWLGDLVCTSECKINPNECYEIVNISKGQDCLVDWNCRTDEKCVEKVCTKINYYGENVSNGSGVVVNESISKNETSSGCKFLDELLGKCGVNKSSETIEEDKDYEIIQEGGDLIVIKDGEVVNGPATLKTCKEINGSVCTSSQICSGNSVYAKDNLCCVGSCSKQTQDNENKKLIGWIMLGIVFLLILIFFSKFRNSSRRKTDYLLRRR